MQRFKSEPYKINLKKKLEDEKLCKTYLGIGFQVYFITQGILAC